MTDINTQFIHRNNYTASLKEGSPVLKEGQMVYGQLKQLLPGQRAEVQIGSEKWIARLEMPMKAGDSYYFQVQATEPEIQLKVVAGPLQVSESQGTSMSQLIDAMKLPKSEAVEALLSLVVKQKLSMTKEEIQMASKWLESLSPQLRSEALAVIKTMAELKLPMSESIFRTLLAGNSPTTMHKQLSSFQQLLAMEQNIDASIKEKLLSPLQQLGQTTKEMKAATVLGQSIQMLLNEETNSSLRFTLLQTMKEAGLLPSRTSLANLSQMLLSEITFASNKEGASHQSILQTLQQMEQSAQVSSSQWGVLQKQIEALENESTMQKQEWTTFFARLQSSTGVDEARNFIKEASFLLFRQIGSNLTGNTVSTHPNSFPIYNFPPPIQEKMITFLAQMETATHPQLQQIVTAAENSAVAQLDGKIITDILRQTIRTLGINVEADIRSGNSELSRLAESFKPQLVQLLQQSALSPALRESAEQLLGRMNAPLLSMAETTGQQQITMQLPLEWFGKKMDATLQWSSRLKEDGKLDPNYARILFYLTMSSIGETVIDMQVQNRIVTLSIYEEKGNLQPVGTVLQSHLQQGLEQIDYHLSGISFKPLHPTEQKTNPIKWGQQGETGGVDIRI